MADKEKKVAEVESKPKKPAKEKKKGKLKEAWRGFRSEVKKVVWPSWKQVLKNTGIVLVVMFLCAVMIAALDYAFGTGIASLTTLFKK
ncbi:MAG: preprotein translocase subunit SecE [Clostridia bacterium]|nr:preprotein translocase subunit SecE [Clostridia bacterium]